MSIAEGLDVVLKEDFIERLRAASKAADKADKTKKNAQNRPTVRPGSKLRRKHDKDPGKTKEYTHPLARCEHLACEAFRKKRGQDRLQSNNESGWSRWQALLDRPENRTQINAVNENTDKECVNRLAPRGQCSARNEGPKRKRRHRKHKAQGKNDKRPGKRRRDLGAHETRGPQKNEQERGRLKQNTRHDAENLILFA